MGHFGVVKTLAMLHEIFISLKWKRMCNVYVINA
jgi:hypothetical protein